MNDTIIFIDVDGVLNTLRSVLASGDENIFDPIGCRLIQLILNEKENVKLVVSSTWRFDTNCIEIFYKNGFKQEHFHKDWRTGYISVCKRGEEIQQWLDSHKDIKNYCIIDDDSDMLESQKYNFVKIDSNFGITYDDFENICKIILEKDSLNEELQTLMTTNLRKHNEL